MNKQMITYKTEVKTSDFLSHNKKNCRLLIILWCDCLRNALMLVSQFTLQTPGLPTATHQLELEE